jgi:hypothetical protein
MTKNVYTYSRASQQTDKKATEMADQIRLFEAIDSTKPARLRQILKEICILHPPAKQLQQMNCSRNHKLEKLLLPNAS